MEISLKRNYGFELIFKADNVNVVEDIEERIYAKNADGKSDFSIPPKRDIQDDAMEQISRLLDDMAEYRQRDFDSSGTIERLFEKLPETVRQELLSKLVKTYEVEESVE
jgi:hypothetical protein